VPSRLLEERFARQGLAGRAAGGVAEAAARGAGIQAQDGTAARLGIRARAAGLTDQDVTAAIAARAVARTWLMRGTVHLVDAGDLRWLVRLLGPSVQRKMRSRWRQIGLTDALLDRSVELLPDVLRGRALSRHEIVAELGAAGLTLDSPDPQAPTHLVVHASTAGLICRGADRGGTATFVLLDEWLPEQPRGQRRDLAGDAALAELARRYFTAFGPATAADFTAWSGLAAGHAVDLIRDDLTAVDVAGRPGFRLGDPEPTRAVRLLPAFDNYLVGYRHRDAILAAQRRPLIFAGGMIHPSVVVDGRVVGRWSLQRSRDPLQVTVRCFEPFPRRVLRELDREVADLGRFLARPVAAVSTVEI
jgi:hypothetical protein